MPLVEIVTSVLLTYASSEYMYGSKYRCLYAVWVVIILQLFEAILALGLEITMPKVAFSLPIKILLVSGSFCGTLWFDCSRSHNIAMKEFFVEVWKGCLFLFPVFPFVAIFISFIFMLISNVFIWFAIPTQILNWPIYYGTLYGPFAIVYHRVKKKMGSKTILP
jgi:hypothetical protein